MTFFSNYAIIGLQFGSEGKGGLAGHLALKHQPRVCVSNWSPNAGHTFNFPSGRKLVVNMIPIGAYVSENCKHVLLGPGSILDPDRLREEVSNLKEDIEVIIHGSAAVVLPEHRTEELRYIRIGSTMKGSGAAAMARMERDPTTPAVAEKLKSVIQMDTRITVDTELYNQTLRYYARDPDHLVQVEGCQGFSLSLYHGMWPYTTSRDCTIHQLKADIAWPNAQTLNVIGCIRTFPIRVANRGQDGTSGPGYHDQVELDWEKDLEREAELTTVTKLPRRIFTFSFEQLKEAVYINAPDALYLSFLDYVPAEERKALRAAIEGTSGGVPVRWASNGPGFYDLHEDGV